MGKVNRISLTPAKCAVDLSNGSERGYYVCADYILQKLKRPHRAVNIMYCYYPLDKGFPKRAQDAYPEKDVAFAWDFPYDNYFPYLGGLNGSRDGEPFTCMQDIRRHGQDVILTLTCDPHVSDEHIIAIAKDLRNYGRMMLRMNHEATGDWFSFNKRCSYQEVADFFVRFKKIMSEYAPNVKMILCIGGKEENGKVVIEYEKEFTEAVRATDIWSVDNYIALNWGWPYEIAEKDNKSHKLSSPESIYDLTKRTYLRYKEVCNGVQKPMVMSELNVDGDVTGQVLQAEIFKDFTDLIKADKDRWFSAFCMYQFRDDGRLGLEMTDPNNKDIGIEQPLLSKYRDIIADDFFNPGIVKGEEVSGVYDFRWGGSEDADGIGIDVEMEKNPVFCEAFFEDDLLDANLMIEFNGRWFYKAPGVKYVDFMPAFYDKPLSSPCILSLNIFAPPASGINEANGASDWDVNCRSSYRSLPKLRIRFEPVMSL